MIPYDFTYNPAREFAFTLGLNGNGKARVYLDNVKLVKSGSSPGKNEKELVLEDFEGPAYRWIGNFQKSDGAHGGNWCGRFDVDFSRKAVISERNSRCRWMCTGRTTIRIEYWYKFEPITGDITSWTLTLGDKSSTPGHDAVDLNQNHPVKGDRRISSRMANWRVLPGSHWKSVAHLAGRKLGCAISYS